ncbi:MAG: helix-turn-helix domain-containing protein [Lachnospiraceae bacterium]|nr:helix-turn-helix domain-containing protein [Lachnospiraceae bacterium]
MRLKILEFVLWAEHEAYMNAGLDYHFSDRGSYLELVTGAEKNSDLRGWFVGKFADASRNMSAKNTVRENQLVARAKNYIQENFQKDLSLDEMSKELDISPYYFSKLFKEETGSNFVEYVTGLRIERAKQLLADETLSMKEICAQIGYRDPNYFSRIFKKNTGVTPTEFRGGEKR